MAEPVMVRQMQSAPGYQSRLTAFDGGLPGKKQVTVVPSSGADTMSTRPPALQLHEIFDQ